jgi:hypothetical protein
MILLHLTVLVVLTDGGRFKPNDLHSQESPVDGADDASPASRRPAATAALSDYERSLAQSSRNPARSQPIESGLVGELLPAAVIDRPLTAARLNFAEHGRTRRIERARGLGAESHCTLRQTS